MQIITTTDQLHALITRLSSHKFVTVDTEFMRERTYWPDLSLIQIASLDEEAIIDPLAKEIDLGPFFELMQNKEITKVFHAARQDIEIIHNLAGIIPAPLFDTQVAAMVCGFGDSVSYSMLVQKIAGHQLDKSSQYTDWSKRPLSEKQLRYAMGDVTHLRDIYQILSKQLSQTGRRHWLQEEMAILTSPETYILLPDQAWTKLKMKVKSRKSLAIMIEVAAWREDLAQKTNTARRRVIKDDAIYDIAAQAPKSREQLANLRTVSEGLARSEKGKMILAAVDRGLHRSHDTLPQIKKGAPLKPEATAVLELLRIYLKAAAASEGVAPKLIASTQDLEKLALSDDADIRALSGWRRDLFGENALKLKQGKRALAMKNGRVTLIEI